MFHAPTSDSKQQAGSAKADPPTREQAWQPAFDGSHALGLPPVAGGGLPPPGPPALRSQQLARLQRAYGNQAVLRMLERSRPAIQPKLVVNEPGDAYEQEADRVAEQVMRMPAPELSIAAAPPQVSRKCAACEEEKAQMLQTKPAGTSEAAAGEAPGIVHEVLRSPGQALDPATRAFMEPRFGHDFGQVRVHSDERAAESTQAVNALAYTVGRDIVLGSGQYKPETTQGRGLLAHELTHVVQQGASVSHVAPPSTSNAPAEGRLQRYSHSDCSDDDLKTHIWPADGIARKMVENAILVLTTKPTDPAITPLLSKYFMSSTPSIAAILHVFNNIQGDFTGNAYTYQCDNDCKDCSFVRDRLRYIGISPNIHLCMNILGSASNDCYAYAMVHEFGHYSAHLVDNAYCHTGCCGLASCPASLSEKDALDNADSFGSFAHELYLTPPAPAPAPAPTPPTPTPSDAGPVDAGPPVGSAGSED
jgi:hypothetical protein